MISAMPPKKIVDRDDGIALNAKYHDDFKRMPRDGCAAKTMLAIFELTIDVETEGGVVPFPLACRHPTCVFAATLGAIRAPIPVMRIVLKE